MAEVRYIRLMRYFVPLATTALIVWQTAVAAEPARILSNQIGYETSGPKRAVIEGSAADGIVSCALRSDPDRMLALEVVPAKGIAVASWRDWRFWTIDFSDLEQPGTYTIECRDEGLPGGRTLHSAAFKIQGNVLERGTIPELIAYFKTERSSGVFDRADSKIRFADPSRPPIDAHGGWYDATGDYGIHFSQLDYTSYFNTQQVPLVVYSLARTHELLGARVDPNFAQLERRLADEAAFGADFLVRMHPKGGSFYESIDAPGPGKKAEDRRIDPTMTQFTLKKSKNDTSFYGKTGTYEVSWRSGGGFAIAALAAAARLPVGGDFDRATYLNTAEDAFTYLQQHNRSLLNDGVENIVDDYCALLAASELLRTTQKEVYRAAARQRAQNLMARLVTRGRYRDYWRADSGDRPFFNPADAGAPVVALLDYYPLADRAMRARIRDAVRRSLNFELWVTGEVANPFGLARQYVQTRGLGRRTEFFFPHDTETAPWWQGEDARLASLAAAARLALPLFARDPVFAGRLRGYATDQLNWILGLNPFDASMMQGVGRNNPQYGFFSSWQYANIPGGIVNGITSAWVSRDDTGIDLNLPYSQTHQDADWRWSEQWLPHSAWFLLAVAAREATAGGS